MPRLHIFPFSSGLIFVFFLGFLLLFLYFCIDKNKEQQTTTTP